MLFFTILSTVFNFYILSTLQLIKNAFLTSSLHKLCKNGQHDGYALNFEQPTVTISVANKHKNLAQDQNLASACFMLNQQTLLGRISTLRGELEMVSSLPLSFFAARREGGA